MKIDQLLSSLTKVKRTGDGRWMACCPAHDDRSPSLTIRQTPDTVMLYCWSGCSTEEVLAAVSMTFADLYPDHGRDVRPQRFNPNDVLQAMAHHAFYVGCVAETMRHRSLTEDERDRLHKSASMLQQAARMTGAME